MIENNGFSTVDGVRAIELLYRPIKNVDDNDTSFYQTELRLNGPQLGVLLPKDFIPVAELSEQCISIFKLAFVQLLQAINKFKSRDIDFSWISVYMPVRFLRRDDCVKTVTDLCGKLDVMSKKICFEISDNLLLETDGSAAENINVLRDKGFHFLLNSFGGDNCNMIKMADFNVDFVMLSSSVIKTLGSNERADSCVRSLINFVNDLGAEPVATEIFENSQRSQLSEYQCLYYTGDSAGKYIAERYMRRRSNQNSDF